jgi:site-specific DNA recombinase
MHTQISTQPEGPYIITFFNECFPIRRAVGIAPLGYKKIFTNGEIMVVPDKNVTDKVILAFELAARGKSFREILKTLNAEGLRSSRGNALSLSSLLNMLVNPFYIGFIRSNKEIYDGQHESLISKSLFKRVQKKLNQNFHRRRD